MLRPTLEIVFWIYDNFDINFGTENYLTNYLKECCW